MTLQIFIQHFRMRASVAPANISQKSTTLSTINQIINVKLLINQVINVINQIINAFKKDNTFA